MNISQAGVDFIKQWEGLRLYAYKDSAGVWTIGYGHTATARQGQQITEAQAEALLRSDLKWAVDAVNGLGAKLTQPQFDALVSFAFNVGARAFRTSSPARFAKEGKHNLVPSRLLLWVKARNPQTGNLETLPGLVNRRTAEGKLYSGGKTVQKAPQAPAPSSPERESASQVGQGRKWLIAAVAAALAVLGAWIFGGK